MKVISWLVLTCLTANVFASSSIQTLERNLDDYQYALTVEWDQKDTKFYDAQTQEFFAKLGKQIAEEGLTQADIMALLERKVANKAAVAAIKLKLTTLSNVNSSEELARVLKENSKEFYVRGASWNGESVVPVVAGLLLAGVIGYAIWWSATHECISYASQWICRDYNNTPYTAGYNGGYYGGNYTTCGYEQVCTQYQKKD